MSYHYATGERPMVGDIVEGDRGLYVVSELCCLHGKFPSDCDEPGGCHVTFRRNPDGDVPPPHISYGGSCAPRWLHLICRIPPERPISAIAERLRRGEQHAFTDEVHDD